MYNLQWLIIFHQSQCSIRIKKCLRRFRRAGELVSLLDLIPIIQISIIILFQREKLKISVRIKQF